MNGIFPLWKPVGMTSHDCVIQMRKTLSIKKIGHTGTLDPDVSGVLPICIGTATKIVPFLTGTTKTYTVVITLGKSTDTGDAQGNTLEEKSVTDPPSPGIIQNVLESFVGDISQVPPMYSAVKVDGKKLYEYARAGEAVERPVRHVSIKRIALLDHCQQPESFRLEVECGKGTYMRTLCEDIGEALGYPAHMSRLIRTQTAGISRADTYTFKDLENAASDNSVSELLLPMKAGLTHLDDWQVDKSLKNKVFHGQKLTKPDRIFHTDPFRVSYNDELLAIYQTHPTDASLIKPIRVFHPSN